MYLTSALRCLIWVSKTRLLIFTSKSAPPTFFIISINNNAILPVTQAKSIRIILDFFLSYTTSIHQFLYTLFSIYSWSLIFRDSILPNSTVYNVSVIPQSTEWLPSQLQTCTHTKQQRSYLIHTFPTEVNKAISAFLFQLSHCKFFATFYLHFLHFLLMILLFKMDSKFSAEVVSSILMFKKAVICLTKKNRH